MHNEHGILDMVVKRGDMNATLTRLIGLLTRPASSKHGPESAAA